jgi:hypothetical protein
MTAGHGRLALNIGGFIGGVVSFDVDGLPSCAGDWFMLLLSMAQLLLGEQGRKLEGKNIVNTNIVCIYIYIDHIRQPSK